MTIKLGDVDGRGPVPDPGSGSCESDHMKAVADAIEEWGRQNVPSRELDA